VPSQGMAPITNPAAATKGGPTNCALGMEAAVRVGIDASVAGSAVNIDYIHPHQPHHVERPE
jgi:hypothetical protein